MQPPSFHQQPFQEEASWLVEAPGQEEASSQDEAQWLDEEVRDPFSRPFPCQEQSIVENIDDDLLSQFLVFSTPDQQQCSAAGQGTSSVAAEPSDSQFEAAVHGLCDDLRQTLSQGTSDQPLPPNFFSSQVSSPTAQFRASQSQALSATRAQGLQAAAHSVRTPASASSSSSSPLSQVAIAPPPAPQPPQARQFPLPQVELLFHRTGEQGFSIKRELITSHIYDISIRLTFPEFFGPPQVAALRQALSNAHAQGQLEFRLYRADNDQAVPITVKGKSQEYKSFRISQVTIQTTPNNPQTIKLVLQRSQIRASSHNFNRSHFIIKVFHNNTQLVCTTESSPFMTQSRVTFSQPQPRTSSSQNDGDPTDDDSTDDDSTDDDPTDDDSTDHDSTDHDDGTPSKKRPSESSGSPSAKRQRTR